MNKIKWRLALDLGTNSLGWAVFELDDSNRPKKLVRLGVRIFPSGRTPKEGASLSESRRTARGMRRRRDRYVRRRNRFIKELSQWGLLPTDFKEFKTLESLNPWRLRAEALERELTPYEVGRALFHLQQRRGFKSNRKTDKADDKEEVGMKGAIAETRKKLSEHSTLGQYLWGEIKAGRTARARKTSDGTTDSYNFYADRAMAEQEFDSIWKSQSKYHPGLFTDEANSAIKNVLFFQRELLPPVVGNCTFDRNDKRAPIALPSSQLYRLANEVNHLRVTDMRTAVTRPLTREERDKAITYLSSRETVKIETIRSQLFGKAEKDNFKFTLEDSKREKLKGNETAYVLKKPEYFGDYWDSLELASQDEIVEKLLAESSEKALIEWLVSSHKVSEEQAEKISNAKLVAGYLNVGRKFISKVLPFLIGDWNFEEGKAYTYDKAALLAGYNHSFLNDGVVHDLLPYYGEALFRYTAPAEKSPNEEEKLWGKIGNPTVHIGLNQIRKVVNTLIGRYGKPTQVVLEVARELKNNLYTKQEVMKAQKVNQDRNDKVRETLKGLQLPINAENILRQKLYDELGAVKQCVYTGKMIPKADLFTNEFQIDHILPLSKSLDDSYANKVLVHFSANKFKGNKSPYEAFGHSPSGYDWGEILARAQKMLPSNKVRKFSPTAMETLTENDEFLARQLTDTAYLARVAREYLEKLFDEQQGQHIWVTPGRLTALMRGKWGLNDIISLNGKKNRDDHRHHAIDAAVIGVTDRSLLKRVATAAAKAEDNDLDRSFGGFPDPYDTYREEVVRAVNKIVVSHKPDHGPEAALHDETARGIIEGPFEDGTYLVRGRIELTSLKKFEAGEKLDKELETLEVSTDFKHKIEDAILLGNDEKGREVQLAHLAKSTKRYKIYKRERLSVIPIYKKGESAETGAKPYKGYKGNSNYCYEIYVDEKGKWTGDLISTFTANSKEYRAFRKSNKFHKETFSGTKLIMRLMSNDTIAIGEGEGRELYRLQKLSEGILAFAPLNEANVDARTRTKELKYLFKSPSALQPMKSRRVFVDSIGRVFDPGPIP